MWVSAVLMAIMLENLCCRFDELSIPSSIIQK